MSDVEKARAGREARANVRARAGSCTAEQLAERAIRGYLLSEERRKQESRDNAETSATTKRPPSRAGKQSSVDEE